jgi:putative flavoprotein involved in K+ transport
MYHCGIHNERYDEVEDIARGRRLPSSQLVGSNEKPILDLNSLSDQGATITGRFMGVNNGVAQFSGSVRNVCALADLKMRRLLNTIDKAIPADVDVAPEDTFEDTRIDDSPTLTMNLGNGSIRTIIWATGFRPDYSWLDVPVLDRKGHIKHDGGVVESPGLYVLGLPLMRRRKSSFIFGIEDDARDITDHLIHYLNNETRSNSHGLHRDDSRGTGFRHCA